MPVATEIVCPSCGLHSGIELPADIFRTSKNGLVTVNVPSEMICEHTFQVFLDKNGTVRGYQRVDFELDLKREIRQTVEDALKDYRRMEISLQGVLTLVTSDIFLQILKYLLLKLPITLICGNPDLLEVIKISYVDKFPEIRNASVIPELDYTKEIPAMPGLVVDLNLKMVNQDTIKAKFTAGTDLVKEIWHQKDAVSQKIAFTSFVNNQFGHLEILALFLSEQKGVVKFEQIARIYKEKARVTIRKEEVDFLVEMLKAHHPTLAPKVENFEARVKKMDLF